MEDLINNNNEYQKVLLSKILADDNIMKMEHANGIGKVDYSCNGCVHINSETQVDGKCLTCETLSNYQNNEQYQRSLVSKLLYVSGLITKNNRKGSASYVTIPVENIKNIAMEFNVSEDEVIEMYKKYLLEL